VTAKISFRVWCLSWDEDDAQGADVLVYDITTHDYASQVRGVVYAPNISVSSPADAARAYAEHVYRQRDGWDASWPLAFRVRSADGSEADFEVTCEQVPEFCATPLKKKRSAS
jgi:hypothetical protein